MPRRPRPPHRSAREHDCVAAGELSFKAADGTKLVAHRFGKGATAVILGHQSQGDLCEWLPYARRLAGKGYFVLALDFRSHGLSQARSGPAANRLASDLAAAAATVRKLGKKKVYLVGASMGGIATLVAGSSLKPAVDGVVSVSSPAAFMGMNAVATAPRLRVPVLYLAATGDDNAGYDFSEDAEAMFAKTAARGQAARALARNGPRRRPDRRLGAGEALVEGFLKSHWAAGGDPFRGRRGRGAAPAAALPAQMQSTSPGDG